MFVAVCFLMCAQHKHRKKHQQEWWVKTVLKGLRDCVHHLVSYCTASFSSGYKVVLSSRRWSSVHDLVWIVFRWNDCSRKRCCFCYFLPTFIKYPFLGKHKLTFTNSQLLPFWVIWPLGCSISHMKQVEFFILIHQKHLAMQHLNQQSYSMFSCSYLYFGS